MNQEETLGQGSIKSVLGIVEKCQAANILLVTGKGSYSESGAKREIEPQLHGRVFHHFNNFSCDPKIEDVYAGIKIIRQINPDLIIAVGGGSVIDMGKLINILAVKGIKDPIQIIKNSSTQLSPQYK